MTGYVLAIDQGTTSSRAIVFDDRQQIAGLGRMDLTQHFPASGWVEHVPDEIWATCLWSARTALRQAGLGAGEIAAIGITNQRETTIVWDRATGKPIHNAIVWQDRRTAPICERLRKAGHEKRVTRKDRAAARPLFLGHQDRLDSRPCERRTPPGGAWRTRLRHGRQLPHLAADRWPGCTPPMPPMPAARCSTTSRRATGTMNCWRCCACRERCCRKCATAPPISARRTRPCSAPPFPSAAWPGDQQAASIGQACFSPGMMKSTYGTGCFACSTPAASWCARRNRLLTTVAYRLDGGDDLCARRRHLRCRRLGAMAARRAGADGRSERQRQARRRRRSRPERLSGAGLRGARRALVGRRGARRHLRPHPQHHARRAGAGGARIGGAT